MHHNLQYESSTPDFVKVRNNRFREAYKNLVITIDRIQGFLPDEYLRGRIESDMYQKKGIKSTILQCTTPFCIISLGCDDMGRLNLVYSVDYRIKEMIGDDMATTLIRRIYDFTPGEMEVFVRIGSLCHDCVETFNQLIEEMKVESFHTFNLKDKNT
ncbi:MAG: hypothetical protein RIT43_819 [Bacteroidota bacterium]|jgi:bacterioferritin-associated ferredoxin